MNIKLTLAAAVASLAFAGPAAAQTAPAPAATPAPAGISGEQIQKLVDTLKARNEEVRTLKDRVRELEAAATLAQDTASRLAAAEKALAVASQKNQALLATGEEIIAKYEKMGLGKRAASGEPFTQLYRVRMQNEMQAYRDQIAELGFYPEKEMQPAQPAPAGN
jgi:hypothetical protein